MVASPVARPVFWKIIDQYFLFKFLHILRLLGYCEKNKAIIMQKYNETRLNR